MSPFAMVHVGSRHAKQKLMERYTRNFDKKGMAEWPNENLKHLTNGSNDNSSLSTLLLSVDILAQCVPAVQTRGEFYLTLHPLQTCLISFYLYISYILLVFTGRDWWSDFAVCTGKETGFCFFSAVFAKQKYKDTKSHDTTLRKRLLHRVSLVSLQDRSWNNRSESSRASGGGSGWL